MIVGPGVLVPARLCASLRVLLRPGLDQLRRDGVALPAELAEVVRAVDAVARFPQPEAGPVAGGLGVSADGGGRLAAPFTMSTTKVASILGVTPRRVRQLAAAGVLGGRLAGGRWQFDHEEIARWAEERRGA